jgi:hypothetical protein
LEGSPDLSDLGNHPPSLVVVTMCRSRYNTIVASFGVPLAGKV